MTELAWDGTGERFYETGVDHGVLYLPDDTGAYPDGVAWNGLTTLTESPGGAAATAQYADNIKYLNLISAETFDGTIEALTYPDEFEQFDGLATPQPGVLVGQQSRKAFGMCYRTLKGNDVDGNDLGFKLHLVYGVTVSPSQKAYGTVNDTPAPIAFSWAFTTTPVAVTDLKPTALIIIDSTEVDGAALADLLTVLYGGVSTDPRLPLPDEVIALFGTTPTEVLATEPAFDSGTNTITIPTVAGVAYQVGGVTQSAGALVITEDTIVTAVATGVHYLNPDHVNVWEFDFS